MEYKKKSDLKSLFDLITVLRGPKGCPWDKKQTPETMVKYLVEESCEARDSVLTGSRDEIIDELGDVLFQLLFIVSLYQEKGAFNFSDIIEHTLGKMVSRHPHVFGDEKAETVDDVEKTWTKVKKEEKGSGFESVFDKIPSGLPALMLALKVSKAAVDVGFEWDRIEDVLEKLKEEIDEFKEALDEYDEKEQTLEFGDILFTLVNIGRFFGVDSETALIKSSVKFQKRFRWMEEEAFIKGEKISDVKRPEMEELWNKAKSFY